MVKIPSSSAAAAGASSARQVSSALPRRQKSVFVITSVPVDPAFQRCIDVVAETTEPVELEVHAVGADEDNWAVGNLFGSALTGELAATVTSYASRPAQKTLALELNGVVEQQRQVSLGPGENAVVEFDAG